MRKLIIAVVVMLLPLAIASCNTFKGMGQDMEASGRAINNAAR